MDQLSLSPPEPSNFRTPNDWLQWKWNRHYQQLHVASVLVNDSLVKGQVNTFLYCVGEEAEANLTSINATEEERKDYIPL